jgi:hypothetical protein
MPLPGRSDLNGVRLPFHHPDLDRESVVSSARLPQAGADTEGQETAAGTWNITPRADDGVRTRDPDVGNVVLYH